MDKLVIIDGNAIIHRAYHAIPPLTDKNGRMVNAVYGFASMLLKVWNQLQPKYLAVTFDVAGPTFRHEKFKTYKATRVKADQELYDQIPLVHDLVRAFSIPIYEKQGYEADDVIGTIVRQICHCEGAERPSQSRTKKETLNQRDSDASLRFVRNDIETYIVTGDMDTLQLINDHTKVYTLRKGMSDVIIYDAEKVKERYGFGPEMIVDYKALRGDASDNIPGVPGIGEKTATELIVNVGGVDKIYDKLKIKNEKLIIRESVVKKLKDGEESAKMSRELARIDCHVPELEFDLAKCVLSEFDKEKVLKLFQELEFTSLLKRIPGIDNANVKSQITNIKSDQKFKIQNGQLNFIEIKKDSEVKELVKKIKAVKIFGCEEVINGNNVLDGDSRGLVFVVDDNGYWVESKFLSGMGEIFQDKNIELVGHELKSLVKVMSLRASDSERGNPVQKDETTNQRDLHALSGPVMACKLFDTQIASYLLNPGTRSHDPASIILKFLGKNLPASSNQASLFGVDPKVAAEELFLITQTVDKLKAELDKINNLGLAEKIEMPLIHVLAEMELNGVAIDERKLSELSKQINLDIKEITAEIYKLADEEFNIASNIQLREVLFEKIALPTNGIKRGKTGYSTDSTQLEKLRDLHPIIAKIENYRELEKLRNTYIDVLPTLINKKTNRIHTTFNQAVTATGRLSSSDPNLQNIPIRTGLGREIRKAFVAEKENSLVVADYSQIELRIIASLAKDKKMMEIFNQDLDIHKATAAFINDIPLEKVTKEMRSAAKAVNFGVLYGMGSYGLSGRTGMQVWEAKDFIKKYFGQFSDVRKYLDQILEFTKKEGYCETLFGRRRYLPELHSPNFQVRSGAERMAINHPIQGTAADIMKLAMISVYENIKTLKHKNSKVKITLQVHDELVLEVKKGLEKEVSEMVKKVMEGAVKLNVPIKVDVSWGDRWGEIK